MRLTSSFPYGSINTYYWFIKSGSLYLFVIISINVRKWRTLDWIFHMFLLTVSDAMSTTKTKANKYTNVFISVQLSLNDRLWKWWICTWPVPTYISNFIAKNFLFSSFLPFFIGKFLNTFLTLEFCFNKPAVFHNNLHRIPNNFLCFQLWSWYLFSEHV